MENEILLQISEDIRGIKTRLDSLDQELTDLRDNQARSELNMTQQLTDLRDSQARSELNMTQQLAAMRDSQAIIIDMGNELLELVRRERKELDDSISAKVAVDAKLVDHERRIDYLEQKVAV